MATTAKIAKEAKEPKFKVRLRNRCQRCGRPRAYLRKFALCRLCFRKLALEGDIAGVTKSSWYTVDSRQSSVDSQSRQSESTVDAQSTANHATDDRRRD